VTKRVGLARIKTWKLDFEPVANSGSIQADYTYDGETWRALPPGQAMALPEPKPDYLSLRFQLAVAPDGLSPYVAGVGFSIVPDDNSPGAREKRYIKIN
jgi:hypothetical protein